MGAKQIDLTGRVFGRLTALHIDGAKNYNGSTKLKWKCACSCGGVAHVTTGNLKKENGTRSCGCLKREVSSENGRKSRDSLRKPDAGFNKVHKVYIRGARVRGHEWGLSAQEVRILFESDCFYCGKPPSNKGGSSGIAYKYNGIDRLDNKKGYFIGNVVSCCAVCNHAKHTMHKDDFFQWVESVYLHIKNTGQRAIEEIDKRKDDLK